MHSSECGIRFKSSYIPLVNTVSHGGQTEILYDCNSSRLGLQLSVELSVSLLSSLLSFRSQPVFLQRQIGINNQIYRSGRQTTCIISSSNRGCSLYWMVGFVILTSGVLGLSDYNSHVCVRESLFPRLLRRPSRTRKR